MAILRNNGSSRSVTEGWRALQLFTNRTKEIRHFVSYLLDSPGHERILFFYGDGGNGKSLLLRYLREHYCKYLSPENWEWVSRKSTKEIVAEIRESEGEGEVVSALIDLGAPPRGDDRPQEAFSALITLRRSLSGTALRFPLFDFACVWYLFKTHRLSDEKVKALFPSDELDVISELAETITGTSWSGTARAVLGVFDKHLRGPYALRKRIKKIGEEQLRELQRMDPESELLDTLPSLFAQDLNASMLTKKRPRRVVLFFDTHEAFWGPQRDVSNDLFFQRDEWLRRLLGELHLDSGIVTVVAGREVPRWSEASRVNLPKGAVDIQLIGHLTLDEACDYLSNAGIPEKSRLELTHYSEVDSNQVHPFLLGLCADVFLSSHEKPVQGEISEFGELMREQGKLGALINRFLRYVDRDIEYAVRSLSACRAFDRHLFISLGESLNFRTTNADFDILTNFSFVWHSDEEGHKGKYRIHELVRRVLWEQEDELQTRAHEVLEQYYQGMSGSEDPLAIAETIYHRNRIDWKRGVDTWIEKFIFALGHGRFDVCRILMELKTKLIVKGDLEESRILRIEGDFFIRLARRVEALEKFRQALEKSILAIDRNPKFSVCHRNHADLLTRLAEDDRDFSRPTETGDLLKAAIARCDIALELDPEKNAFLTKGRALKNLGALKAHLYQYETAASTYSDSIESYDSALTLSPDFSTAKQNKALALQSLGILRFNLSDYDGALESYEGALELLDQVLNSEPDNVGAFYAVGGVRKAIGNLKMRINRQTNAMMNYQASITAYDQLLTIEPDYISAYDNKGSSLSSLGEIKKSLYRYEDASNDFNAAIRSFEEALVRAPHSYLSINLKGIAFRLLANVQWKLSSIQEAFASYEQALQLHRQANQLAPDFGYGIESLGETLAASAFVYGEVGDYDRSMSDYKDALVTFKQILDFRPESISPRMQSWTVHRQLGDLLFRQGLNDDAISHYREAITECEQILQIKSGYFWAHNMRGIALLQMGRVERVLGATDSALLHYREAVASFDVALSKAPENINFTYNKAKTLQATGDVYFTKSELAKGIGFYKDAVAVWDALIVRSPDHAFAHNYKGTFLKGLGDYLKLCSQHGEAEKIFYAAIASHEEALLIEPEHLNASINEANTLIGLGQSYYRVASYDKAQISFVRAIEKCELALQTAPHIATAKSNKAAALYGLATVQERLSLYDEAIATLEATLLLINESLGYSPEYKYLYSNKVWTLRHLGWIRARLSHYDEAQRDYDSAIATADESIKRDSSFADVQLGKASTLSLLGNLQIELTLFSKAVETIQRAIDTFDEVLRLNTMEFSDKPIALERLGNAFEKLQDYENALLHYNEAIVLFDRHLSLASQNPLKLHSTGVTLGKRAALFHKLGQRQLAIEDFKGALDVQDTALGIAPAYPSPHSSKAETLLNYGLALLDEERRSEAMSAFHSSVAECNRAFATAPALIEAIETKGKALKALGKLYLLEGRFAEATVAFDDALKSCQQALSAAPNRIAIMNEVTLIEELLREARKP